MSQTRSQNPSDYLSSVNLALPSLPPIEVELNRYIGEPLPAPILPKYAPNKAGVCHSALSSVQCVSFLHEAVRTHRAANNGDVLAVCGGRAVAIYALSAQDAEKPFDVLSIWEDELEEEFYTVRWGLVPETDGSCTPWVAAAGKYGLIKVLDTNSNTVVKQLCGHKNAVRDLMFFSDAHFLLSCSDDYSVRLWHVLNHIQVAIFHGMEGHDRPVLCLDIHYTELLFLSAGMDRSVKLWKVSEDLTVLMRKAETWDSDVKSGPQGVECATNPFPTRLEYRPQFSTHRVHKGFVDCAKFYGNFILSKCQEGVIMLWKVNEPRKCVLIIKELILPSLSTPCFPVKFALAPEYSLLVIGGEHSDIHVYQLLSTESRAYCRSTHTSVQDDHIVTCAAFSSSFDTLIACTNQGVLLRYDSCP